MMTPLEEWEERERQLVRRAVELCRGVPDQYNLSPVIDLLRTADALGFDVVRKTATVTVPNQVSD